MEASCYGYFLRIYPQRMAGCHWQPRRNNHHSSNGVVKQTCRHYLRHIRNAINQKDGKGTKRSVRSELQDHRTTTDTPGRCQRGTQITIIQNGVVCIALGRPTAAWMMCRRGLHWLNVLFQFFFYRDCPNSTSKWSSVYELMTEICRVRTKIVLIESYDQGHVGLLSCGLAWYKFENWIMNQQLISCFDSTQGSIFVTN